MESKPNYIPIPIPALKDCFKDLGFDVYIRLSDGKFVKAFDQKTGLDFQRLANYEKKGVDTLYINEKDKHLFDRFLTNSPMNVLTDPKAPVEEKKKAFVAAVEQAVFEVFENTQANTLATEKALTAFRASLDGQHSFSVLFPYLVQLSANKDIYYRHGIFTCIYSYLLAVNSGMASTRSLSILLFSAIFHDLGKMKLPEELRIPLPDWSPAHKNEFKKHVMYTVEVFQNSLSNTSTEILRCLEEHKECQDGTGYPNGIAGSRIYTLTKILSICDTYSEMLLGLHDGNKHRGIDALRLMEAQNAKFDTKIFKIFYSMMTEQLTKAGNKAA